MPTERSALTLYVHPLSSYCWKVLIALYDAGTAFHAVQIDGAPSNNEAYAALWPIAKIPLLLDGERVLPESSIIIEYLHSHRPGSASLIPENREVALEVRLWDRFFDLYVHSPVQTIVADRMRPPDGHDPVGVREARATLERAYALADARMSERTWAVDDSFSMADCAALPALFYARAVHPCADRYGSLADYFERLVNRPSVQRVIAEARPWMMYFPFVDAIEPRFLPAQT